MAKGSKKGMGFKAAASNVAKREGMSMKSASAVIASGARKASAGAKRMNPALNKVKGARKRG